MYVTLRMLNRLSKDSIAVWAVGESSYVECLAF